MVSPACAVKSTDTSLGSLTNTLSLFIGTLKNAPAISMALSFTLRAAAIANMIFTTTSLTTGDEMLRCGSLLSGSLCPPATSRAFTLSNFPWAVYLTLTKIDEGRTIPSAGRGVELAHGVRTPMFCICCSSSMTACRISVDLVGWFRADLNDICSLSIAALGIRALCVIISSTLNTDMALAARSLGGPLDLVEYRGSAAGCGSEAG